MSASVTMGSTKQAAISCGPMERLPAEIKLQLFIHCTSFEMVINLQLVSRSFSGVYKVSSRTIIKQTMEQLAVSKGSLKLAAMAVEASKVNPLDKSAITALLHQYFEKGVVSDSFYDKRNIAPLSAILSAASSLVALQTGFRSTLFTEEDNQRLLQGLLRVEIAKNLFHGKEQDGSIIFKARFPKLEKKYWLSYSAGGLGGLRASRDILSRALCRAVRNTQKCPHQEFCTCSEYFRDEFRRDIWLGFSQSVGLKTLNTWVLCLHAVVDMPFNQFLRENRSHFDLTNYYNQLMGAEETPKPIVEIATLARKSATE
ncbi:hypothetical protein F5X99DRAFT_20544 [Biscogniauxia marginata]|nr:hypothetical protein F5X99DRAFT_20544 [Biscogniauxia marginata]